MIFPEALLPISLQFLFVNSVKLTNMEQCFRWTWLATSGPGYGKLLTSWICCSWLFCLRAFCLETAVFNSEHHEWHFGIVDKILVSLFSFLRTVPMSVLRWTMSLVLTMASTYSPIETCKGFIIPNGSKKT